MSLRLSVVPAVGPPPQSFVAVAVLLPVEVGSPGGGMAGSLAGGLVGILAGGLVGILAGGLVGSLDSPVGELVGELVGEGSKMAQE